MAGLDEDQSQVHADVVLNALTIETQRLLELEMIPNYKPRSWLIRTAEARGREEGRELGREIGREEGRREALQSLVRRVVQARFGPLPTWAQAQIDAASADELETWVERAFTSSSADELLGR